MKGSEKDCGINESLLGGFVKTGSATKDFLGWEARGGCLEDPEFKTVSRPAFDWVPN